MNTDAGEAFGGFLGFMSEVISRGPRVLVRVEVISDCVRFTLRDRDGKEWAHDATFEEARRVAEKFSSEPWARAVLEAMR